MIIHNILFGYCVNSWYCRYCIQISQYCLILHNLRYCTYLLKHQNNTNTDRSVLYYNTILQDLPIIDPHPQGAVHPREPMVYFKKELSHDLWNKTKALLKEMQSISRPSRRKNIVKKPYKQLCVYFGCNLDICFILFCLDCK